MYVDGGVVLGHRYFHLLLYADTFEKFVLLSTLLRIFVGVGLKLSSGLMSGQLHSIVSGLVLLVFMIIRLSVHRLRPLNTHGVPFSCTFLVHTSSSRMRESSKSSPDAACSDAVLHSV